MLGRTNAKVQISNVLDVVHVSQSNRAWLLKWLGGGWAEVIPAKLARLGCAGNTVTVSVLQRSEHSTVQGLYLSEDHG